MTSSKDARAGRYGSARPNRRFDWRRAKVLEDYPGQKSKTLASGIASSFVLGCAAAE